MKSWTHLLQSHLFPREGSPGTQLHAPTGLKIPILKLCSGEIFGNLLQTTNPRLPNNLIFQAEDYLLCVGSSFSLCVSMHAVNHSVQDNYNSGIHTPHFVHLRLRPPVSSRSMDPQEPMALIHPGSHPKIKWVTLRGPCPSPRTAQSHTPGAWLWESWHCVSCISKPKLHLFSPPKKISSPFSRSQDHKWVDCPDTPWAPALISKYISPFKPQHKVVRLNCSILSFFKINLSWQPQFSLETFACCHNSFKKHSV